MLYLYGGEAAIEDFETGNNNFPFDDDGYPLPPEQGSLRGISIVDPSGNTFTQREDIYFQKGGGWYRETGGPNPPIDINQGNNPHVGRYDGGSEYIRFFESDCFIPDYKPTLTVFSAHTRLYENLFINYNYGLINGMPVDFDLYVSPLTLTNQKIGECIEVSATIDNDCPPLSGGTTSTILEQLCIEALQEYNDWVQRIKNNPYLLYSPEWEIVKRNNEIASKNYFDSVNAAACADNSCINICIDTIESVDTNPCDEWTLVDNDNSAPFIYFTDEDGNKVLFDDFPICCVANGGVYKEFQFQNGREACYCARSAPCNGLVPSKTRNDGIVLWEQTDGNSNVPSQETIMIGDNCYYITAAGAKQGVTSKDFFGDTGQRIGSLYLQQGLIEEAPCHGTVAVTTTKSSAECCVWYGYAFDVDASGDIVCVDNSGVQGNTKQATNTLETDIFVEQLARKAKSAREKYGRESSVAKKAESVYVTNKTIYEKYNADIAKAEFNVKYKTEKRYAAYSEAANLNTEESLHNTLKPQYERLNRAVYLKFTTLDISSANFESSFENPDLNDCVVWQPNVDQHTGFVTFQVTDVDGETFKLPEDRELYKNCCLAKGYTFGCFQRSGADNSLIPVDCENTSVATSASAADRKRQEQATNAQFMKCVDPDFIKCDEIDDVKLIFSANEWNGFYLPVIEDAGVDCNIDIGADIMIRYDAQDLINCASKNNCGFHYSQYDNSLYDVDCMNWITFTEYDNVLDDLRNNKQIVDLNQIVEWEEINGDYIDLGDYNTSQYVPYFDNNNISVWQTPGLQSEPSQECCEALGGTIVDVNNWTEIGRREQGKIN
jgi:hypothetical protein